MMGEAFQDPDRQPLGDEYLMGLLDWADVWVYSALVDRQSVAGLTAHELPMTRGEITELFVYDIAVRADSQRRGIGRALTWWIGVTEFLRRGIWSILGHAPRAVSG
jgi:aminoglycoside 3-N-acetyltransferase I